MQHIFTINNISIKMSFQIMSHGVPEVYLNLMVNTIGFSDLIYFLDALEVFLH